MKITKNIIILIIPTALIGILVYVLGINGTIEKDTFEWISSLTYFLCVNGILPLVCLAIIIDIFNMIKTKLNSTK